ncbi:semaphorin-7A [Osmerus eperlanus]|uniref:semaphorin-7A n=1 Tax=Osmerus eperlanus TaxID=29151 RepID=UPI002E1656E2
MSRYLSSFVFSMAFFVSLSLKNIHVTQTPRITLTAKEFIYKRLLLPEQRQVELLKGQEEDKVYVGGRQLLKADFHARQIKEIPVFEKVCDIQLSSGCQYNITVLHSNEDTGQLLICGTNGQDGMCCHKNPAIHSSECSPSEHMKPNYQEREPSLLMVTPDAEELYTTRSGTEGSVGIYRFGKTKTTPKDSPTELRYLSLVMSGPREERLQDKLYAFYMEKNPDLNPGSELWIPRVAQICMADVGGPKGIFQYSWTSQLRARLLCGDQTSKQYFSQLVDTATLKAERWQDTRVYGLFRNTWGMSAVCVYTMEDIDSVFKASNFKGYTGTIPSPRPGICSPDSTKPLSHDFVTLVNKDTEMEDWVMPTGNTGPLLVHHHNYTHILGDRVQTEHTVLFLSTEKGVIHKVLEKDDKAFVIAEYQPFSSRTHILNMMIHSSSGKLYVSSSSELVQVNLVSCGQYGPQCEDCVLARDPYCGWNGTHCAPATRMTNVTHGDATICKTPQKEPVYKVQTSSPATDVRPVKMDSKHFLICPISSNHAQYSWYRNDEPLPFLSTERECLLLIESMSFANAGTYRCESEEGGYRRTLAQYTLQVEDGTPGLASCPLGWIIFIVTVVQMLMC